MAKDFVNITDTFNLVSHSTHKGGHTWSSFMFFSQLVMQCSLIMFLCYLKFLFPVPQFFLNICLIVCAFLICAYTTVEPHSPARCRCQYTLCIASRHHHRFSHYLLLLAICTLLLHSVDIEGSWEGLSWHQLLSGKRSLASCPPPPFASLGLQAGPVGGLVGCSAAA